MGGERVEIGGSKKMVIGIFGGILYEFRYVRQNLTFVKYLKIKFFVIFGIFLYQFLHQIIQGVVK